MLDKITLNNVILIVSFLLVTAVSKSEVIQTPEQCLNSLKGPCLVYIVEDFDAGNSVENGNISLQAKSGTQIQFKKAQTEDRDFYSIDLIKGKIQIQSKIALELNGISLEANKKYFAQRENTSLLQLFDVKTLEISTYKRETQVNGMGKKSFMFEKSEFPSKERLVKFLAPYYLNRNDFDKDLKTISVDYKIKLQTESYKLQAELKKSQQRAIASAEYEAQNKKERERKALADRKKSRALFFMRTFEE